MGIALSIVWTKKGKEKSPAIKIFLFQLSLNFLWSLAFFGFHLPLTAFVIIAGLWISIFLTIKLFQKISKLAAYLLYPYLFWVSFAAILNLAIVLLN
jgi:translocator protein